MTLRPLPFAVLAAILAGIALTSGCSAIYEYPDAAPEQSAEACIDGIDNDVDGRVDCQDAECARYCREDTDTLCRDGADNDQDGRKDCKDSGCADFCPEADSDACGDGADNDFDGAVDCEDPDCEGFCPEETQSDCSDGLDNDGDGLGDTADPRCWLWASPSVQRCAGTRGVEVFENFDAGLQDTLSVSEWRRYGVRRAGDLFYQIVNETDRPPGRPGARQDRLVTFDFNTTASDTLDSNLGALVRQKAFSGRWKGFELSFIADIPPGTLLRAAIVPAALAPTLDAPLPGAETAQVGLTLDTAHWPATIALNVENVQTSSTFSLARTLCTTTAMCDENFVRVRLALDHSGFVATATSSGGEVAEVRGNPPSSSHLAPSRLVFSGGSTDPTLPSGLDDVRMSVHPELPCGFAVPQIPGESCDFSSKYGNFGRAVSVARRDDGPYCALVTASAERGSTTPEALTAWESDDGVSFRAAPETSLAESLNGAALVGAGIAHDGEAWRVAITYRERKSVRLGFSAFEECGAFEELEPGPVLFEDAEAPSYVLEGDEHEVYFTRPPTDQTRRTLWRIAWREGQSTRRLAPELLAELPPSVDAPVSVTGVGSLDRVLTYPMADGFSPSGVGILVANESRHVWLELEPTPLLALPEGLESWQGRLSFDDRGAVSSALSWGPDGGLLIYGGSAVGTSNVLDELALSVGTASIVPANAEFPSAEASDERVCGDGNCDANEQCETCALDCPCPGLDYIADATSPEHDWTMTSAGLIPSRMLYRGGAESGVAWTGGPWTWSALPLDQALSGDFELSFDLHVSAVDKPGFCSWYVGLGAPANPESSAATPGVAPSSGVFAEFGYSSLCNTEFRSAPFVTRDGAVFATPVDTSPASCATSQWSPFESWRHVVLRKRGSRVSVLVPARDGCGVEEYGLTYSGAVADLRAVVVGFGGGPFAECSDRMGSGTVANLRLRLLETPESCPGELCPGLEPICVDTQTSPEHCGACGHACSEHETCSYGHCTCSDLPGILDCDGSCVDSLSAREHCGECRNECRAFCANGHCDVVAGDCASPKLIPRPPIDLPLDFTSQPPETVTLCSQGAYSPLILGFTPETSGDVTIAVDVSGTAYRTLLAVTSDRYCRVWTTCNDDDPGPGSSLDHHVTAGVTYKIAVALRGGSPAPNFLPVLRIHYR